LEALRLTDEQRKAAERIAEVGYAPDAIFDKIRRTKPEEVASFMIWFMKLRELTTGDLYRTAANSTQLSDAIDVMRQRLKTALMAGRVSRYRGLV